MLKHTSITLSRIDQFIQRELESRIVLDTVELDCTFCDSPCADEQSARAQDGWVPIERGFKWGPAYSFAWFRAKGQVPDSWTHGSVCLVDGAAKIAFELGGKLEATIWHQNSPVGGLDLGHHFFRLGKDLLANGTVDLFIQAYAHNTETAIAGEEKPRNPQPQVHKGFKLALLDDDALQLFFDCMFACRLAKSLEESDPSQAVLVRALNEVCNLYDPEAPRNTARCRKLVKDALGSLNGEVRHTITPVGHAHLDTAWLWPLEVTRFKMAHTTAMQLDLMERYPEYLFVHSQASQYEWLEQEYPVLFERVKQAIAAGQWEPLGSMWVEADCNLTGSEALVRQFLYGIRYFQQKLGVATKDMWLPDVFGYSAAIPQILTKFGLPYFLTQKMSWNQFNKIPHHTFWWQGIDGSRVWTHFPPADTYNAFCEPKEILDSVKKFKDHGRSDRSMLVYGFGDGGSGPTEWHIESLRRARQTSNMPEIESKQSALSFFKRAKAESQDLCTWVGELYFEMHRGTYTSQAENKRANRETEFLLRDAEWLSCFAYDGFKDYPAQELDRLWKLVLLNQFHDIIPGSSVREVYQDSDADYAEVRKKGAEIVEGALRSIASRLDTQQMKLPVALFHNSSVPSQGEIPWDEEPAPTTLSVGDDVLPVQVVEWLGERKLIFQTPDAALGGIAVGDLDHATPTERARRKAGSRRIENDEYSVRFDANGNITSIQMLEEHPVEFVEQGKLANMFQILDDHPLNWSAWDVDIYSLETAKDLVKSESFEIVERGPVRVAVEVVKKFGKSTIRQRISLGPTPGIRFDTWVDWHEDNKMLKVAFPVNVHAMQASYEIQFGHVQRPNHRNTSWDLARFEVCNYKWFDLSEGGHGLAVLNEGKYGCDVAGNVMRLSLLRSPKAPDPICDMGQHRFTYVLLPHFDGVLHSDVVASSYALNAPVRAARLEPSEGVRGVVPRLVGCDNRDLVVETVKKAEDSNKLVVRVYECHNTRGRALLECAVPIKSATLAALDESPIEELELCDGAVLFDYKPFEIITLVLEV